MRSLPDRTAGCSIVVLTLNERINIEACLSSLKGLGDVHVLDSGSSDDTSALAERAGATVTVNPFRSFAQQRNWAHDHLSLASDWVLHLDADERMTPALAAEIGAAIAADDGRLAGWLLAEKTLLNGRWLRHAAQYPRYQARLVHRRRMRFVDHGHGQREESSLPLGRLREPYEHHAFSHGIEHWLIKHAGYAMREARQMLEEPSVVKSGGSEGFWWWSDPVVRRRALKRFAMRLPMRPALRWLHVMAGGGWRDGAVGWQYARMMFTFQQMIDLCRTDLLAQRSPVVSADAVAGQRGESAS